MAASVDNRQFMEPSSVNGGPGLLLRPIKPGPVLLVRNPDPPSLPLHDSSSEDEDDDDQVSSYSSYIEEIIFKSREGGLETTVLDPRDESTADNWVERHPSMVRLTGKHPFNAEAPLDRLMRHGFITPVPLHYVRNHGYVPKATWRDWTVEVTGLVKRPHVFTMDQLVSEFPSLEIPVTLVCAGNRRREQNMVKQSKGFNWGAAGVSTSVWRGVPLREVLKRCGILKPSHGALNVCFEGGEDLPGGGGSKYGTSVSRGVAMDPTRDIMLAYMQNGEVLKPDHGFPVRMIIPGHIGGRMVKWVKKIMVTPKESENFYHYKDNRVLPSHVDDLDLADAEGWWYKPEHIINELNVNSVITTPAHDEVLPISTWTMQKSYTLKGYAYSGGGRKVTRVEVTLNGGETWRVCDLDHPERPTPHGKYWCWCFWQIDVEVLELLVTKEIAVRAWDESHNTQPEKLIWNLMGMMNNCWFRVKTNMHRQHQGEVGIVFEHPTVPGNQSGGWMMKQKPSASEPTLKKSVSTPLMVTSSEKFPMSVVKAHNSAESPWIIVHGHVYDCTGFLKEHPGGADSILINAGSDCTEEFDAIHSDKAKALLEKYRIGELLMTGNSSDSTVSTPNSSVHGQSNFSHLTPITEAGPAPPSSVALIPREKIRCKLVKKTVLSHDVRLFRFALPSEDQLLGLPVGKHVFICASIDGKLVMRAYTPTSDVDMVGHFELLIKVYFKNVHPEYPNGGLMSQYLESLPLDSYVEVKGPLGHIEYAGRGKFLVHGKPKPATKLAMICGGTGITPIYQVIQAIMKDPEDRTEMYVVYANRTEDDILLREQLDEWASKNERLKVWYVVNKSVRGGWKYSLGRINEKIMREHLPQGSAGTLALACGPPGMIQSTAKPILEKMKYDVKDSFLVF